MQIYFNFILLMTHVHDISICRISLNRFDLIAIYADRRAPEADKILPEIFRRILFFVPFPGNIPEHELLLISFLHGLYSDLAEADFIHKISKIEVLTVLRCYGISLVITRIIELKGHVAVDRTSSVPVVLVIPSDRHRNIGFMCSLSERNLVPDLLVSFQDIVLVTCRYGSCDPIPADIFIHSKGMAPPRIFVHRSFFLMVGIRVRYKRDRCRIRPPFKEILIILPVHSDPNAFSGLRGRVGDLRGIRTVVGNIAVNLFLDDRIKDLPAVHPLRHLSKGILPDIGIPLRLSYRDNLKIISISL